MAGYPVSSSILLHTHVPYTQKTNHLIHPCSRQNMLLIYKKTPGGIFKDFPCSGAQVTFGRDFTPG